VTELPEWLTNILGILLSWLPLALWVVWWLLAVNWKKAWSALAQGAWLAVLLLMFLTTLVWSYLDPSPLTLAGAGSIPAFWWRLGCVCALTLVALFCGWLQGTLGWTPPEIELEPAEAHADGHGHH
jgi:hypothetical protein